jgi:hypothetical protein
MPAQKRAESTKGNADLTTRASHSVSTYVAHLLRLPLVLRCQLLSRLRVPLHFADVFCGGRSGNSSRGRDP